MTPVETLRAAGASLRESPGTTVLQFSSLHDDYAANHMIATCTDEHKDGGLDQYGCCRDCTFIGGYDPDLVSMVAALLMARKPLAGWFEDVADDMERERRSEPETSSEDYAVTIAKEIRKRFGKAGDAS